MARTYAEPAGALDSHFTEKRRYSIEEANEERGKKNWWKYALFMALGVIAVQTLVNLYVNMQRKEIPYVYQVEKGSGAMLAIGPMAGTWNPIEDTVKLWVREFVKTLRRISEDTELMKDAWKATEWRVTKAGHTLLLEYLKKWKPLEQRDFLRVDNIQLFRRSSRTYDVRWQETKFDRVKREVLDTTTQRGTFTFQVRPPQRQEEKDSNPAGIFFDAWDWSEEK